MYGRRAVAKTKLVWAALSITILIAAVIIGYLVWAYAADSPPFCSGYPPGGNCPGNYSATFRILVNYTGSWEVTYHGHGGGSSTNGSYVGIGPANRSVLLSGPNTEGLQLCTMAKKLDGSNATLLLSIYDDGGSDPLGGYYNASAPYGATTMQCVGVVP